MNARRRKAIREALEEYEASMSQAKERLAEALEAARDEEEAAFDALPEAIQYGEKGEAMQDCISALEEAMDIAREDPDMDAFQELCDTCGVDG